MQQCIDEKTDDLMKKEMGENQKTQCSKNEMRKEGDKVVAESVCKLENSTATDPRRVYGSASTPPTKSTSRAPTSRRYEEMKEASSVIEAKWLGPCKAGQKPGDIVMPGMPNINMDEMRKGASKGP